MTLTVASALVAVNIALFVLIAEDILDGGGLVSHDHAVLDWFVDQRTSGMITAARVVSAVGSFGSLLLIGSVVGLWLWRRGTRLAVALAPDVSLALAGLAASIGKAVFDRPRPPAGVHATHVAAAAFPPGHATDAVGFFLAASLTLALTTSRRTSIQIAVALALSPALVGCEGKDSTTRHVALTTATAASRQRLATRGDSETGRTLGWDRAARASFSHKRRGALKPWIAIRKLIVALGLWLRRQGSVQCGVSTTGAFGTKL